MLSLPNRRSEYWQIIEDIEKVVGLKINTLSIGALLLASWARQFIPDLAENPFFVGNDASIRTQIENAIGCKVEWPLGHLGILESAK